MPIEVGAVIEGTVKNITNFGAFVQLPDGKTGLVHISEVADIYVKDIHEHLKENDRVKVKVLSVDKGGKISLSIKKAVEKRKSGPMEYDRGRRQENVQSFEDRLAKFLKDSEEKQQQLKKHHEARGGRGNSRVKTFEY
ncbi:MAG: S1 domain-containing RNA-binding protein [Thermoanaerobacteraceae bacterium]|nr:S1 domain-containing RNA-binding protein [Thermoanaerobacteraceae bacterium]